ncbi:uncharacterized protein LOC133743887 [Rosa rugosa]|uniref:uncharacterized protein LOC133743887 n=1 Tax=Rosa rugosa TaxID=74645 RepID=UPI002B40679B|nr:uncharacterized protein LOC133743887 [Rosa rugosa]
MECSQNPKVSKEEVIAKLKDDGDFDRLRRKIIQKLKNNEELRENIISIVKQSQALNRPGAENMKPRQLSDDIYQEVGGKVMSQISDGLWGIIRSSDAMQSEISETVQSVYNKLANPQGNAEGHSSTHVVQVQLESSDNGLVAAAAGGAVSDNHQDDNNHEAQLPPPEKGAVTEEHREMLQDKMDTEGVDRVVAPGVSTDTERKQECDGSDEDPDVPPGFG